jgi:hypothetical protein
MKLTTTHDVPQQKMKIITVTLPIDSKVERVVPLESKESKLKTSLAFRSKKYRYYKLRSPLDQAVAENVKNYICKDLGKALTRSDVSKDNPAQMICKSKESKDCALLDSCFHDAQIYEDIVGVTNNVTFDMQVPVLTFADLSVSKNPPHRPIKLADRAGRYVLNVNVG